MKNIKEKAAFISIMFKMVFTIMAFIAFSFTGSIAILAEAWHSFTDILTSLLVYFSVKFQNDGSALRKKAKSGKSAVLKRFFYGLISESRVSLFIGIILFSISIGIFRKAIIYKITEIQNALPVGILYIVLSFCSYIVYRFETSIGTKENSVALISDGKHSRADMAVSLLAGFSLILYKLGINIDRPAAVFIGIFILFLSVEIVVNFIISLRKKDNIHFKYKTIDIINFLFEKRLWLNVFSFIDGKLKINPVKLLRSGYFRIGIVFALFLSWFSTCFYVMDTSQLGIIERFGKCANAGYPVESGLHVKFPWPVDRVKKIGAKIIRQVNIGNVSDENAFALLWTQEHGSEEPFLSADNNFFYPYIVIHYRVSDIFKYTYGYRNKEQLLDDIAHKELLNIFSQKTFYQVVIDYRPQMENDITKAVQEELDLLGSGLELVAVDIKDIHPPVFIAHAFEDVIAAFQDKKMMINEAIAYKNESVPCARGEAAQKINGAESYVISKINSSDGDAKRFEDRLNAYKINRGVGKERLYIEYITKGMSGKRKILIDPASGIPEIWLNFNAVMDSPPGKNK